MRRNDHADFFVSRLNHQSTSKRAHAIVQELLKVIRTRIGDQAFNHEGRFSYQSDGAWNCESWFCEDFLAPLVTNVISMEATLSKDMCDVYLQMNASILSLALEV